MLMEESIHAGMLSKVRAPVKTQEKSQLAQYNMSDKPSMSEVFSSAPVGHSSILRPLGCTGLLAALWFSQIHVLSHGRRGGIAHVKSQHRRLQPASSSALCRVWEC